MPAPRRPAPEPLDVDAARVVAAGTILWFVGFLVLLVFRARLTAAGHEVWLWTCLAGTGLGLIGFPLCLRERSAARRARAQRVGSPTESTLLADGVPAENG
jgi:hypothetical protein